MSILFDYLLISWVTNCVSNCEFLTLFLYHIDRELHSLKCLDLKFGLGSEFSNFFDKIPVRILLDVLFCVLGSLKCLFVPWHLHSRHLKLRHHLDTETDGRLPWQFCNFTCEITNYRWNLVPELGSNSSPMILIHVRPSFQKHIKFKQFVCSVPCGCTSNIVVKKHKSFIQSISCIS